MICTLFRFFGFALSASKHAVVLKDEQSSYVLKQVAVGLLVATVAAALLLPAAAELEVMLVPKNAGRLRLVHI